MSAFFADSLLTYRGGSLDRDRINYISSLVNQHIRVSSFIATSKSHNKAEYFMKRSLRNNEHNLPTIISFEIPSDVDSNGKLLEVFDYILNFVCSVFSLLCWLVILLWICPQ